MRLSFGEASQLAKLNKDWKKLSNEKRYEILSEYLELAEDLNRNGEIDQAIVLYQEIIESEAIKNVSIRDFADLRDEAIVELHEIYAEADRLSLATQLRQKNWPHMNLEAKMDVLDEEIWRYGDIEDHKALLDIACLMQAESPGRENESTTRHDFMFEPFDDNFNEILKDPRFIQLVEGSSDYSKIQDITQAIKSGAIAEYIENVKKRRRLKSWVTNEYDFLKFRELVKYVIKYDAHAENKVFYELFYSYGRVNIVAYIRKANGFDTLLWTEAGSVFEEEEGYKLIHWSYDGSPVHEEKLK